MKKKGRKLRAEILEGIDVNRICNIPVAEKFVLVGYIQLIANHAEFIELNGIAKLRESDIFTQDKNVRLLSPLLIESVDFRDMREIMQNYMINFDDSDAYYARFAVISIGILSIKMGLDHLTIFHLLLSLLGVGFITENLKYVGYKMARESKFENKGNIEYKEYELAFRDIKYDILALRIFALRRGQKAMEGYLYNYYENEELVLLYRILKNTTSGIRYSNYKYMIKFGDEIDKMILAGVYSLLSKKSIMTCHYMMNSMIGKYSHFDQRPERVEKEARDRYKEMKALLKKGEIGGEDE